MTRVKCPGIRRKDGSSAGCGSKVFRLDDTATRLEVQCNKCGNLMLGFDKKKQGDGNTKQRDEI